jgi:hypothetical protein
MKREPMGHEREQDSWLGTMLRRSSSTAPGDCLDGETLAAWADGGLSTKAAAAVELHASSCSRCMAVLAAMERTAPAPSATHAWTPARLFRWAAPLAAAATAVAIWVVVPDRLMTPVQPAPAHDVAAPAPHADSAVPVPVPVPERGTANVEPRTGNREPGTRNPERSQPAPSARLDQRAAEEAPQMRDELRRERAAPQALGAAETAAPEAAPPAFAPEVPPAAPPAAPAPQAEAAPPAAAPSAAQKRFATDTLAESATAANAQRSMNLTTRQAESIAPSNALMRWRVVQPVSVERSRDGGKTWTKTTLPAQNVVSVRAVDADRAVATASDKTEFYTTNAGRSWTRVQENSAAPF